MSAPNFAKPNTSRYYAFGTNKYIDQEAIDANEWSQEWLGDFDEVQTQMDFDYTLDECKRKFKELGWEEDSGDDGGRSYCGVYFASKTKRVRIAALEFYIKIRAKVVGAYYEGATFDFDFEQLEVEDRDDCFVGSYYLVGDDYWMPVINENDIIKDNWLCNRGLSKLHAKRIINAIESVRDDLINEAEEVFSYCCEHELVKLWQGSNGEASYGPADNKRCQLKSAVLNLC